MPKAGTTQWPPPPVRVQVEEMLRQKGQTLSWLARKMRVDPNLLTQLGRTRPRRIPPKRRSPKAKGVRPPPDRRVKCPLRLVPKLIKALGLPPKCHAAQRLTIAALLDHCPPEMAAAIRAAYKITAKR